MIAYYHKNNKDFFKAIAQIQKLIKCNYRMILGFASSTMETQETVAQMLLRTAQRYYQIRHLDLAVKQRLMALNEDEFMIELANINHKSA